MPEPKDGETREDFVERCMSDEVMVGEYEDEEQRYAVCNSIYDEQEKESTNEGEAVSVEVGETRGTERPAGVKVAGNIEKRFTDFTEYRIDEDGERKHIAGLVTVYSKLSSVPI